MGYSNLVLRSLKLRPRMRLKPRISVLFSDNAKSNCYMRTKHISSYLEGLLINAVLRRIIIFQQTLEGEIE